MSTDMRGLTVRQPWGTAIARMGKDVENRTRPLGPYRGPVAIHAGVHLPGRLHERTVFEPAGEVERDRSGLLLRSPSLAWPYRLPLGVFLAVVDLTGVHPDQEGGGYGCWRGYEAADGTTQEEMCSLWAQRGHWHHELSNVRVLERPIPAKGALGLFKLDQNTIAAIRDQIGDL